MALEAQMPRMSPASTEPVCPFWVGQTTLVPAFLGHGNARARFTLSAPRIAASGPGRIRRNTVVVSRLHLAHAMRFEKCAWKGGVGQRMVVQWAWSARSHAGG
jgi:hypothetical protein